MWSINHIIDRIITPFIGVYGYIEHNVNDANYSEIYNYVSSNSIEENQDIIGDNIYDELMIIFLISEIKTISMHLLHIKNQLKIYMRSSYI